MNSPTLPTPASANARDQEINLKTLLLILNEGRTFIVGVTLVCLLLGWLYATIATPVYESNLLLQVEENSSASKALFGEAAAALDSKTAAQAEMEILRSRTLVAKPVDELQLNVRAEPHYFPIIGAWLARKAQHLSTPGLLGYGGYVWGNERIQVSQLSMPDGVRYKSFEITAGQAGQYTLQDNANGQTQLGQVGQKLRLATPEGPVELVISVLNARAGARFQVVSTSRLAHIEALQQQLQVGEVGRPSGIVRVTLRGTDPKQITQILNTLANGYVAQNVQGKSEEVEKTLAFLDMQLPALKTELDNAESRYNQFRRSNNSVDLEGETGALLSGSVAVAEKLQALHQKRVELLARYTPSHPQIEALDRQQQLLRDESAGLARKVQQLPQQQQDALRLERDVKITTTLYTSVLQSRQQLKLAKAGKVGSVRLIDAAVVPEVPVQPRKAYALGLGLLVGLALGVAVTLLRRLLRNTIEGPDEVERLTGQTVLASILHSPEQAVLATMSTPPPRLLVNAYPHAPTVEGLRSFMTSLQFTLGVEPHQLLMISGPTPDLGKSFISVNLASLMALHGQRVLLIDGDLRRGHLHDYFGLRRQNGWSELLIGKIDLATALHKQVLPGLDFITTGHLPNNPAELMQRSSMAQQLQALRAQYDLVIIDTPPILPVADTAIIAPLADALIMVVREGISNPREITESVKRLTHVGVRPAGVVLNGMQMRSHRYGYGYAYEYGYGQDTGTGRLATWRTRARRFFKS
jgi:tyrosine-protein kinase Etk/Wzc